MRNLGTTTYATSHFATRLTTMSFEPSATQSYAYMDNSTKLSGWSTLGRAESFGYDKDTGRLSKSSEATYTFGASSALPLKQSLSQALSDYTFNAKGQRTKVHAGSQPATLTWQGERLISLETSNTRANYAYDASGMRIKADLTGAHGASQTLRYTYDGLRLLEVSSKSSTDTSNFSIGYLYEADNQTPSAASYETSSASVPFTLESNVRGDVIALRDKAGDIFARYTYSEYGVCKAIKTNATECIDESLAHAIAHNQPLRYAGYVYDEYSQMYYCAARYYDPATQVFISLDPARADGERSGYLYCEGDPVNSVDPSGLQTTRWGYCQSSYVITTVQGPRSINGCGPGDLELVFSKTILVIFKRIGRKIRKITRVIRTRKWFRRRR